MPEPKQSIYITAAAADMYLVTSDLALVLGVLPLEHYLLRLRFIRDNSKPGSVEANALAEGLGADDRDSQEEWPLEETENQTGNEPAESQLYVPDDAVPPVLHYLAAANIGLSQWRFHLGDHDFFPSIPHGHWVSDNRRKLDAYRGWIYAGDHQIGREHRWKIIALWNDEKFRSFAAKAIDYYIQAFPDHVWRVHESRRRILPRRR